MYDESLSPILWCPLRLRPNTKDQDTLNVLALRHLRVPRSVAIVVPSWADAPEAIVHPLVLQAVNICLARDRQVIWGRRLWNTWNYVDISHHADPSYYRATLIQMFGETRSLKAQHSMLDCEPYGDAREKAIFKAGDLTDTIKLDTSQAIGMATMNDMCVDFVAPCASTSPHSYVGIMRLLGRWGWDEKTYRARHPDYAVPICQPPAGQGYAIEYWGTAIASKPDPTDEKRYLSVDEFKALQWSEIQARHPLCRGQWIYIAHEDFADVAQQL